ncbi:MAG: GNAT family N-acetyltransferase [Lachnospira sp.]|nr:GNAT family N-acetyltransferase [Lachnospira sp.]
MEIRYMEPTDNRIAISRIYEESWKYAYAGIIPQDYLNSIPERKWVSNLDNPDRKTLICIDDNSFIGTSSFGKSRFEKFSDWGEIISIYLLPDYVGQGYGKVLLQATIWELEKLGYKNIFLWVLRDNIRARYFYERFGFLRTDDYLDDNIGGKELQEVRYIYKC